MTDFPGLEKRETRGTRNPSRVELTVALCCDCEHVMQVIDDGLPGSRKARDPGHPPHSPDFWSCLTNPLLIPWSVRQSRRIAAAPSRTAAFAPWHAFSTRLT